MLPFFCRRLTHDYVVGVSLGFHLISFGINLRTTQIDGKGLFEQKKQLVLSVSHPLVPLSIVRLN